jgi:tetratricopeptide (TPR) repeat protein/transglutaminase-like putative cysteine protease
MPVMKRIFSCRWWLLCVSTIVFLIFPDLGTADVTNNGNPWETAFLTSPASELLSAANEVDASEGDPAIVLLEEGNFSIDIEGRCISRYRLAYRILNRTGVEEWSSIAAGWNPWYQERPLVRARVVTPDGIGHVLSQETIDDSPASESSPNIYSDRMRVRAPLPAVTVGAVVEQEIVIREKEPFFAAGSTYRFFFGRGVRVLKTRMVIESPTEMPIRHVARLLPNVSTTRREEGGRTYLTVESGPMEAVKSIEAGMPADTPRWPNVAFTTGKDWSEVAARYGEIVDRRIASSDLKALVKETVGDARKRDIIAARLLERLRREVRYTGIEFGTSSIIPSSPQDTLRRKYGDCKDQAALMTKMLRTAGIPSYMALIRVGSGEDVDQDLPGLGEFDHAIVYVPGKRAIWIDPTDSYRPAGELPLYDQGRRALIAGGPFSSLIVTAEAPSTINRQVETREFYLAEQGKARVIETTLAWGSIGATYRRHYGESDEKTIREGLVDYARKTYLADGISAVEKSSTKSMDVPFRIRLKMDEAKRGFTEDVEAVVALSAFFLTERLPAQLTDIDKNANDERKHDYLIPEPYVYEARYQIVPPPGFTARQLPQSGTTRIGPMSLSREYSLKEDGSVSAILRFDTVKRRLTPAEFMAARDSLQALREEKTTFVRFEQTGQAFLAAGKYHEALAEFRRLATLHPREALHRDQIAATLLEIGLGNAARKEAERAVALEPNSAAAHRTLAWVLQHDAFGRLRRKGFDRKRAIAGYRKAKALDPDDFLARGDLAILLEFNGEGDRYCRDADLAAAVEEYRAIRTALERTELDDNLLACLYWSERWKELKELALSLEPSEEHKQYILLAVAGEEGAAKAVKETYRYFPDPAKRRKTLEKLAVSLMHVRRYRVAADLLQEAAKGASNSAGLRMRIDLLKSMQRHEDLSITDENPGTVVKRMFLSLYVPETAPDRFISLFARSVRDEMGKSSSEREVRMVMQYLTAESRKTANGVPKEVIVDFALNNMEYSVKGNGDGGYRVDISMPAFKKGIVSRVYVTKEEGRYRIVTFSAAPDVMGLEVLRRLESGDLEGAQTWLDWARDEVVSEHSGDPLSEKLFPRIWTKGATADPGRMQLAAACLLSGVSNCGVIPILLKEKERATGDLLATIDSALARAYLADKRYSDLLNLCDRLSKDYPLSPFIFNMRVRAFRSMNRLDKVIALANARLLSIPKDPEALRVLGHCSVHLGKLKQAENFYRTLVKGGGAVALDFNNLAWLGLFHKSTDEEFLSLAERAVALSDGNSASSLHTLSALYAELGHTAEARETILRKMEIPGMNEPSSGDWYVLGRIAEQFGEKDAAIEAYGKVSRPAPEQAEPNSTYILARKRLLKLSGKSGNV